MSVAPRSVEKGRPAILLGAYAARSCPVKTHHAYDQTLEKQEWQPDESLQELFDGGDAFESTIFGHLIEVLGDRVVDLRPLRELSSADQQRACLEVLRSGVEVIIGGLLPIDLAGHRAGSPDLLIRGEDRPDGRPGYHAGEVKWHRIHERKARTQIAQAQVTRPNSVLSYTTFGKPGPQWMEQRPGTGIRVASREADWIQLAHYHRMLEDLGLAAPGAPRAALIGTDSTFEAPVLSWLDLSEPLVRTFSRSDAQGWKLRSLLERYDHEHGFRVRVAERAQQMTGAADDPPPLVTPIVINECSRCPWWEHCLPQLDAADVSLKINKGALDVREISALRSRGIITITDLVAADLDQLLTDYLPEVTHRSGAEDRLRLAARRATMMTNGVDLERISSGPVEMPAADLEIDFDLETSVDGRVYLWGFLIKDTRTDVPAVFKHFSAFDDLDAATELELARSAVGWLRELVEGPDSVAVYHYSEYEVARIRELTHPGDPDLEWALDYAESAFVDLLPIVKDNYFGVRGLGLKVVATRGAGFHWRDDDPGGLNSQRWFDEAVHGESTEIRDLARLRVLEYNEDDVIATARVRAWLREN